MNNIRFPARCDDFMFLTTCAIFASVHYFVCFDEDQHLV